MRKTASPANSVDDCPAFVSESLEITAQLTHDCSLSLLRCRLATFRLTQLCHLESVHGQSFGGESSILKLLGTPMLCTSNAERVA